MCVCAGGGGGGGAGGPGAGDKLFPFRVELFSEMNKIRINTVVSLARVSIFLKSINHITFKMRRATIILSLVHMWISKAQISHSSSPDRLGPFPSADIFYR